MSAQDASEEDLDDLLDSALEDFAKTASSSSSAPEGTRETATQPSSSVVPSSSAPSEVVEVKGLGMPALGRKKKGKKKTTSSGQESTSRTVSSNTTTASSSSNQVRSGQTAKGGKRATLEQLAQQTRQTVEGIRAPEEEARASGRGGVAGAGPDGAGGVEEEEMVERLVKQFEDMGTGDIQGLMDTMLQQLLSRDVLYEPMLEIRNRYPDWLSTNREKLSPEDLGRYSRQYECIQRLCHLYDTSPDDFSAILACMKEMQECGQPPADIIQDLAPGLEIGEDGLPTLPDLGSGDLPPNCPTM